MEDRSKSTEVVWDCHLEGKCSPNIQCVDISVQRTHTKSKTAIHSYGYLTTRPSAGTNGIR